MARLEGLSRFTRRAAITLASTSLAGTAVTLWWLPVDQELNWENLRKEFIVSRGSDSKPGNLYSAIRAERPEVEDAARNSCPVKLQAAVVDDWLHGDVGKRSELLDWNPWLSEIVTLEQATHSSNAPQIIKSRLIAFWKSRGYLSEFPKRKEFFKKPTSEAEGVDIGAVVVDSDPPDLDSAASGSRALKEWGFCFVPSALSASECMEISSRLFIQGDTARGIGESMVKNFVFLSHRRPFHNRLHVVLRGEEAAESIFSHSGWLNIIQAAAEHQSPERLAFSDARIVVVDCAAVEGPWGTDGGLMASGNFQGYRVIIPLSDVSRRKGGWSILPASHLFSESKAAVRRAIMVAGVKDVFDLSVPGGPWRKGDALVLDKMTIAKSNGSVAFAPGIYLCVAYDFVDGITVDDVPTGLKVVKKFGAACSVEKPGNFLPLPGTCIKSAGLIGQAAEYCSWLIDLKRGSRESLFVEPDKLSSK